MSDPTLAAFGLYIRISKEGYRSQGEVDAQLDRYEVACREAAARSGHTFDEAWVRKETDVSGRTAIADRELEELIVAREEGKIEGIYSPDVDRFARDVEQGVIAWRRVVTDSGGRLIFPADYIDSGDGDVTVQKERFVNRLNNGEGFAVRQGGKLADVAKGSVMRGVHSGSIAPTGYEWPGITIDLGNGRKRFKKSGPLVPNADAPRVREAFIGFADGTLSKADVQKLVGFGHQARVNRFLMNAVYRGTARVGEVEQPDAHEALVDEKTWEAVQHRLAVMSAKPRTKKASTRDWAVLHGVLRCPRCHKGMTPKNAKGVTKQYNHNCKVGAGVNIVQTDKLVAHIREQALRWHAAVQPSYAVIASAEREMLKPLEEQLLVAVSERAVIETTDEISALHRAKALTEADAVISKLHREIAAIESTQGWITVAPERVEQRIEDPEQLRSFLNDMVVADVAGVGQGWRGGECERVTLYGKNPQHNATTNQVALAEVIDADGNVAFSKTITYDPPLEVTVNYVGSSGPLTETLIDLRTGEPVTDEALAAMGFAEAQS